MTGRTGCFSKGATSWNKGKKGVQHPLGTGHQFFNFIQNPGQGRALQGSQAQGQMAVCPTCRRGQGVDF